MFVATWMGNLALFANAELSDPWDSLISRAPYLAALIFLVIYFLRHISAERERDRAERKEDRDEYRSTLSEVGETCSKAIEKNTVVTEKLVEQTVRIDAAMNRFGV